MDSADIASEPLAELFNDAEEPVYLIDEQHGVLFRNAAATSLDAQVGLRARSRKRLVQSPLSDLKLAKRIRRCTSQSRASNGPYQAASKHWLICVSLLPANLAVLHPVFVVRLISWRQLRRIPHSALRHLFDWTPLEWAIISGLTRNDSLRQIALQMNRPQQTIRTRLNRIMARCEVSAATELLALLHKLSRLAGSAPTVPRR